MLMHGWDTKYTSQEHTANQQSAYIQYSHRHCVILARLLLLWFSSYPDAQNYLVASGASVLGNRVHSSIHLLKLSDHFFTYIEIKIKFKSTKLFFQYDGIVEVVNYKYHIT